MSGITLLVEDPKWRSHRGLPARLEKAAEAARRAARLKGEFTLLLSNDAKLRALNRTFRDKEDNCIKIVMKPHGDGMSHRHSHRHESGLEGEFDRGASQNPRSEEEFH